MAKKAKWRIRITGCSSPSYWYKDYVGDTTELLGIWIEDEAFKAVDSGGYVNLVKFRDCVLERIPEEPREPAVLMSPALKAYLEDREEEKMQELHQIFGSHLLKRF